MLTPARMVLHWCQVPQPQSWSLMKEPSPSLLPSHQTLRPPPGPAGSWRGVEAGFRRHRILLQTYNIYLLKGQENRPEQNHLSIPVRCLSAFFKSALISSKFFSVLSSCFPCSFKVARVFLPVSSVCKDIKVSKDLHTAGINQM